MKYKEGEIIEIDHKKARNHAFHRQFFALLKVGFELQTSFIAPEWWREWITIKAGYFESCQSPTGEWMIRAKSISFEKMDNLEFEKLYKDVSNAIIEVCHITAEQLEENWKLFL